MRPQERPDHVETLVHTGSLEEDPLGCLKPAEQRS